MKSCIECGGAAIIRAVGGRCSVCYARELRRRHRHKHPICACCGTTFTTTRRDARYCGATCRQKAYRRRTGLEPKASAAAKPAIRTATVLTPAGNPAGRFSREQYEALDRVFTAAAPLAPDKVNDLIEALGELDKYVQLNGLAAAELTPSELYLRFLSIRSAIDKLLQKLGVAEGMPRQIKIGLEYFARHEAENMGGFSNHPPETFHFVLDDVEDSLTRFHEDRQLQQHIEGLLELREWARQAEGTAEGASRCKGKDSEEAARAMEELALTGMLRRQEFDIRNKIFEIWVGVFGRQLRTSVSSSDGMASGPLIRFTASCLELLGVKSESKTARKKAAKQRRIDDAIRGRVIEEEISGVRDAAAPVIDDATRRRVLEEVMKGRKTEAAPKITEHAIRQHARRSPVRSK